MIKMRLHKDDQDAIEVYEVRKQRNGKDVFVLWGVLHTDILMEMDLTPEDLENCEYTLTPLAIGGSG